MGRRPLKNPKNDEFRMRMDEDEKRELEAICKTIGISKARYIREALKLMKTRGLSEALRQQIEEEKRQSNGYSVQA